MDANISVHQTATYCQCSNGIVAVHDDVDVYDDGDCLPEKGGLDKAAKLYSDEDVWYLEFVDITTAMLVFLLKSPFIQEALECLRTREQGRRCCFSQLLAKELAHKIVVLGAIGERGSDLCGDIASVKVELAWMADTGMIYEDE